MGFITRSKFRYACLVFFSVLLMGCDDADQITPQHDKSHGLMSQTAKTQECHLCGMVIQRFPGPKGQLEEKGTGQTRRFCSTNDLFSYVLQPENQHNIKSVYVHDMSEVAWDSPNDTRMIEANQAWYIAGHDLKGAMGPTIASFATQQAASSFQQEHGGYLLSYADINLELMAKLMKMPMLPSE